MRSSAILSAFSGFSLVRIMYNNSSSWSVIEKSSLINLPKRMFCFHCNSCKINRQYNMNDNHYIFGLPT